MSLQLMVRCRLGWLPHLGLNHDVSFSLTRIARSGDVAINPGPDIGSTTTSESLKLKCTICRRTIASNHRALICDSCNRWIHIKCGQVSATRYVQLQQLKEFEWHCPECSSASYASEPTVNSNSIMSHRPNNPELDDTPSSVEQEPVVDRTDIFKSLKDYLGNKNLKVGHINVNSLINKLNEVHIFLNEVKWIF